MATPAVVTFMPIERDLKLNWQGLGGQSDFGEGPGRRNMKLGLIDYLSAAGRA